MSLPQTEEEFLAELTQDFPGESVDRDDEEDESEESEGEEEEAEHEGEESPNGIRRSQSFHSTAERRPDVGTVVNSLRQEGETHGAVYCILLFIK